VLDLVARTADAQAAPEECSPTNPRHQLPGRLIFTVCDRFLRGVDDSGNKVTAESLAAWLGTLGYTVNSKAIWPTVRKGIARGYVRLCPPRSESVSFHLRERFPNLPPDVQVVDVRPPADVVDKVAFEAAGVVFELIQRVDEAKNSDVAPGDREAVHVGFGGGGTTLKVAEKLARRVRREPDRPRLCIHALSSGFDPQRPLSAPLAFLSYFANLERVEFVGLVSPAAVRWDEYERLKSALGIREAFAASQHVDIVVTSMAQADDEHVLLRSFYEIYGRPEDLARLKQAGYEGDVFWQPFSQRGPIPLDEGIRTVSVFEIPDLVRLAATPGKHVILVAGPCLECGRSKANALSTLVTEPSLRVFNHLVTDLGTAEKVLDLIARTTDAQAAPLAAR
jgi:DNA-binding transcriptional regulator LsrR (DeoR family)